MTDYKVGDRVDRIENREITGATIIQIVETGDYLSVELGYDEGGSGWWPISAIKPINNTIVDQSPSAYQESPSADQETPSADQESPSADQETPSADQESPSAD